jgi:hypothetical protein
MGDEKMKKFAILLFLTLAIGLSAIVNIGDEYIGSTPMGSYRKTYCGHTRGCAEHDDLWDRTYYYYDESVPARLTRVEHEYYDYLENMSYDSKLIYEYLEGDDCYQKVESHYCRYAWNPDPETFDLHAQRTYTYNLQDKLIEFYKISFYEDYSERTEYTYDANGNLVGELTYNSSYGETEPYRSAVYHYDSQNRLTHQEEMELSQLTSSLTQVWSNHPLPDSIYTWNPRAEEVQMNLFDESGLRNCVQRWRRRPNQDDWNRFDQTYQYVTAHQIHFPTQILTVSGRAHTAGGPFYQQETNFTEYYEYTNDFHSVTVNGEYVFNYNDSWLLTGGEPVDRDYGIYYTYTWEYYTPNDDPTAIPPALVSAYPNPAKGMVNISLSKRDAPNPVEAKVYNIKGQWVRNLQVNDLSSDQYHYNWDCKDQRNNAVPAGIYLIRIKTERGEVSKKVTVLK